MKIRTDFVTNSSSSSYCVSFIVKTAANKELALNICPDIESDVYLKEDVESVVNNIKTCESVEELRDLLLNALDLYGADLFYDFEDVILDEYEDAYDMDNMQLLAAFAKIIKNDEDEEFEDYEDLLSDVKKTTSKFKRAMDKIEDMTDIKSVSVYEDFNVCGEFVPDAFANFLSHALPKNVNSKDAEAVRAAFAGKLPELKIDRIIDQIEGDSICQSFDADITTTVQIADGKVEKTYSFSSLD